MRRKDLSSILLLTVILMFGATTEMLACSCIPSAPCQSFSGADVVFIGEVIGSKYPRIGEAYHRRSSDESPVAERVSYESGEIYFDVAEVFKGSLAGDHVTIYSTRGGGDCGQSFIRGKKYVIFATFEETPRNPDDSFFMYKMESLTLKPDPLRLWTGLCSGNVDLDSPDPALEYLRNLPKPGDGGTIEGKIYESIRDYSAENRSMKPMEEAKLRALPVGRRSRGFEGISDNEGNFRIKVPAGEYKLIVELPNELSAIVDHIGDGPLKVDDTECAVTRVKVTNNSLIEGILFENTGKRAQRLSLDLISVQAFNQKILRAAAWAYVDKETGFNFRGIPPGKYYLCLNCTDKPEDDSPYPTWYYPGTADRSMAQVFTVELGTQLAPLNFVLPPKLEKVSFSGTVLWKDGKPARGAEVNIEDVQTGKNAFFKALVTDKKGRFSSEWFAGRRYKIKVFVWEKAADAPEGTLFGIAQAESEEFVLDKETASFRIVLDMTDPRERSVQSNTLPAN